jgi:hypothetical protein
MLVKRPRLDGQETKASIATRMRRLSDNEDFIALKRLWLTTRVNILEDGKKKKQESQWAVLEGFDYAVMEADKWLQYFPKEENDGGEDEE